MQDLRGIPITLRIGIRLARTFELNDLLETRQPRPLVDRRRAKPCSDGGQ